MKVIIVDDEPSLSEIARIFLERYYNFQIDSVTSVKDAIEKLKTHTYDAIVSDYDMPEINGIEFLTMIRSQKNNIPFIIFTGKGREDVAIEALNAGADFYIQKGGEPKTQFALLGNKIKKSVENKQAEYKILEKNEELKAANEQLEAAFEELTATEEELRENYEKLLLFQKELKDKERRLSDIINFLPDATFAVDSDGRVIAWNHAIERMTGQKAPEMIGKGNLEYSLCFYNEKRPILIDMVLDENLQKDSKYPIFHSEGKKLFAETFAPALEAGVGAFLWFTASPLYDMDGKITGAIESIRNTTRYKQNEKKLQEKEKELREEKELYENIIEEQTEFVCRFSPDWRYSYVNSAFCRYFGKTKEELIGHRFRPLMERKDQEKIAIQFDLLTPEKPVVSFREKTITPEGDVRWQSWNTRAFYDRDGKVIQFQSVGRDVTDVVTAEEETRSKGEELEMAYEELTATEEELRQNLDELIQSQLQLREMKQKFKEEKELYENIIEEQTEFVCRFSPDWRYSYVNNAFCEYFGKTKEELIGNRFKPLMEKDDLDRIANSFAALSLENPVVSFRERTITPGGNKKWQSWNTKAFYNNEGNVIQYQSVGRDVTDVVRAEEDTRNKSEELEMAYEELTATEEELRQNLDELIQSQQELRETQLNLREEKELYESIVEEQTEFVCRFSPDWRYSYVNSAFCRYFGKSRDELIGRRFKPLMHEDELENIRMQFASLSPENPVVSFREKTITPEGESRWQSWNTRAFYDKNRKVLQYQSVGRDITEVVAAEKDFLRDIKKLRK